MPQLKPPIFDVSLDRGWKLDQQFQLSVMPDKLCGAYMGKGEGISQGMNAGLSGHGGEAGLVGLLIVGTLSLIGATIDWLLARKRTRRETHIQGLDPLDDEFLKDNALNFRFGRDQIEAIVFSCK